MEDYKGDMNCRAYNASDLSSDHSDTDTGAGRGGAVLTAVCDQGVGRGRAVLTAVCDRGVGRGRAELTAVSVCDRGEGRGGAVLTAVSVCDRVEGMGGAVLTAVCICVWQGRRKGWGSVDSCLCLCVTGEKEGMERSLGQCQQLLQEVRGEQEQTTEGLHTADAQIQALTLSKEEARPFASLYPSFCSFCIFCCISI